MKVALMTYEGTLHTITEWDGRTEHHGVYMRFPDKDLDHYTAAFAIRPEDVPEYVAKCKEVQEKILNLQTELINFKTAMHRKLVPLNRDDVFPK